MKTTIVNNNKLGLLDIKSALWDERFRKLFPELQKDIDGFIKNPGCACNMTLYRSILSHKDRLKTYFPTKEIDGVIEEVTNVAANHWKVINCSIDELERELKKLPRGRKQLAVARYENMVTVVVNELDISH